MTLQMSSPVEYKFKSKEECLDKVMQLLRWEEIPQLELAYDIHELFGTDEHKLIVHWKHVNEEEDEI